MCYGRVHSGGRASADPAVTERSSTLPGTGELPAIQQEGLRRQTTRSLANRVC